MKIRTDFVTNSSSSSFCVKLKICTTDDMEYSLYIDPHEAGTDSSISIRENFDRILSSENIPDLCRNMFDSVYMDDDVKNVADWVLADAQYDEELFIIEACEEATGMHIENEDTLCFINKAVASEKNLFNKLKIQGLLDEGYYKTLKDIQRFMDSIQNGVDDISKIQRIELSEINRACGEFANENFAKIIGEDINTGKYLLRKYTPDNGYMVSVYDYEGMIRKLRGIYDRKCDFTELKEPLCFMNCAGYCFIRVYRLCMKDGKIERSKYFHESHTSYNCPSIKDVFGYVSETEKDKKVYDDIFADIDGRSKEVINNDYPRSIRQRFADKLPYADDEARYERIGDFIICGDALIKYKGNDERVEIPKGIRYIGGSTFADCRELRRITLPENLLYIGYAAFYGCARLERINIPRKVTQIGRAAFYNCEMLKYITFHEGLAEIGAEAFMGCDSLEKVILKDGIKKIGRRAFSNCISLKEVTMPESVEIIEDQVFEGCWYQDGICNDRE